MAVHFVGFRSRTSRDRQRWANAVAMWGEPDYVHYIWDWRAYGEYDPAIDTVVFAGDQSRLLPRQGRATTSTIPNVYYDSKE